jgi:hypothetical protein
MARRFISLICYSFAVRAVFLLLVLAGVSSGARAHGQDVQGGAQGAAQSAVAPEQMCTVAGTVLRKGSDEPVHFARVTVQSNDESQDVRRAQTDTSGKFTVEQLPPGQYTVTVTKNGYVAESYGARRPGDEGLTLTLTGGMKVDDLLFRLTQAAAISGRVRDENGEDLARARVSALSWNFAGGKRTLTLASTGTTNDLGEYRLFDLPPGKYLLSVEFDPFRAASRGFSGLIVLDGATSEPMPAEPTTIYYPGTTDPSQATPVEIGAGAQIRAMDFALQPTRLFHIRGHVTGLPSEAGDGANALVMLGDAGMAPMRAQKSAAIDFKDGSFELDGVAPGPHDLLLMVNGEGKQQMMQRPIEVGGDIETLEIAFQPGATISGHLSWDDPSAGKDIQLQVVLDGTAGLAGQQTTTSVQVDGSFELDDVGAEMYSLNLTGDAPDAYLKAAKYGSSDALGTFQTVVGSGPTLELTVGARGGRILGRVLNGDSVAAAGVWVTLMPEESKAAVRRLYQAVKTDANGKYEIRGVAPGTYRLFSWEDIEQNQWEDPDFVRSFARKATSVEIKEADTQAVDLTTIRTKTEQAAP